MADPGSLLEAWGIWLGEAGEVVETPGTGSEGCATAAFTGRAALGDMEAEEDPRVGTPTDGVVLPLPPTPMALHPGTRFAGLAGPGPSVTATQPGRLGNSSPGSTSSSGNGLGAEHAFESASA